VVRQRSAKPLFPSSSLGGASKKNDSATDTIGSGVFAGVLWGTEGFFVSKMGAMGATPFITGFSGHFFALLPLLILF
jgi:hypothetical protein